MSKPQSEFLAIEIDALDLALDARLAETARRKRIPSLQIEATRAPSGTVSTGENLGGSVPASNPEGGRQSEGRPDRADAVSQTDLGSEPAHRPGVEDTMAEANGIVVQEPARTSARRRPLSLEVPEYLARELKVKAATEAVTVRYLVLSALAAAGYRVDDDELEEDGRRLR